MSQALAVLHHTALSLLWVEGHFLNRKILILLLHRLTLGVRRSRRQWFKHRMMLLTKQKGSHLYFEFLDFFFNLDQVLRLSHRSLPHAVREQGEQTLNHLEERNGRTVQHSDLLNSLYIYIVRSF